MSALTMTISKLYAQEWHKSEKGNFEARFIKGCHQFEVEVRDLSGSNAMRFIFEGENEVTHTTHTYSSPGEKIIRHLSNEPGIGSVEDRIIINVIEPISPEFIILPCDATTIKLAFKDHVYDSYFVDFGDGYTTFLSKNDPYTHSYNVPQNYTLHIKGLINNTQDINDPGNNSCGEYSQQITIGTAVTFEKPTITTIQTSQNSQSATLQYMLNGTSAHKLLMSTNGGAFLELELLENTPVSVSVTKTITGLNTRQNNYCFRIDAFNPCDEEANKEESDLACTIQLGAEAAINQNNITIKTDGNFPSFELNRNQTSPFQIINTTTYSDTDIICNQTYTYNIRAVSQNGVVAMSNQAQAVAMSSQKPEPIAQINASYLNNSTIELNWEAPSSPQASQYFVLRSSNNHVFSGIGNSFSNSFTDLQNIQPNPYCYQIDYADECQNIAERSVKACPVFLTSENHEKSASISWTPYKGWANNNQTYVLQTLNKEGVVLEETNVNNNTTINVNHRDIPEQIVYFRIKAIDLSNSANEVFSNQTSLELPLIASFPNAFNPSSRFIENQTFFAQGRFMEEIRLSIFNRWGELIFTTTSPDGWNGKTSTQKDAPPGLYIYKAEIKDSLGNTVHKKGNINLIRR
jgi:gliding motility-associated-like protein